jgi:hypothetical protein
MTDSVWIEGYEGKYKIFADGRVQSFCKGKPMFLKSADNSHGYQAYCLSKGGKTKSITAHILVAKHFVQKPALQVNHKNCNKLDNRAENLEWVTPQGNTYHAIANGMMAKKTSKPGSRLRPVVGVSIETGERKTFESVSAASHFIHTDKGIYLHVAGVDIRP